MGVAEIERDRHVLYRFYDVDDQLLYIGITANPGRRFGRHGTDKPWWSEVASIRLEVHPDRPTVLDAERKAVAAERPRHNIRLTGRHETAPTRPAPVLAGQRDSHAVGTGLLAVGDVVALRLDGQRCPVGMIRAVTSLGPQLQHMNFMDGTFDMQLEAVPWTGIRAVRYARPKTTAELDSMFEEEYVAGGGVVWDTDPLADFQTEWTHGRDTMLECRAERQRWKAGR